MLTCHGFTNAVQELGHDGAGISTGAIQCRVSYVVHQVIHTPDPRGRHRFQNGLKRKYHVGAGIAIRHGKHVDPVQVLATLEKMADAGGKCASKPRRIKIGNGD